jgi:hypothetical protein
MISFFEYKRKNLEISRFFFAKIPIYWVTMAHFLAFKVIIVALKFLKTPYLVKLAGFLCFLDTFFLILHF